MHIKKASYSGKRNKKKLLQKKRGNEKWILRGFDWHCIVSFNCLLRVWWSAACIQSAKPEQQSWEKHSKASSSMKHTNEARASRQGKGSSIKDIHYMYGGISSTVQVDLSHTNLLVHLFWFSISDFFMTRREGGKPSSDFGSQGGEGGGGGPLLLCLTSYGNSPLTENWKLNNKH